MIQQFTRSDAAWKLNIMTAPHFVNEGRKMSKHEIVRVHMRRYDCLTHLTPEARALLGSPPTHIPAVM